MIVTIAAWLYIVNAVLTLGSLLWSPLGFNGMEGLLTLAVAALLGAMGYGLLKRLAWARWLALGASLIGWTLGSLFLLMIVGMLVFVAPAALGLSALLGGGGILSFFGGILLIALLIWVVTIVISFKLFWYLCSEAGCDEFGVPHGSAQTVLASCAAWVGIFIVNFMGSGGGQALTALMSSGAGDPQLESPMESEEEAAARREAEAYATRRARAEAMLREQAELEAAMAAGEEQPPESDDAEPGDNYTVEEAPVPQLQPVSDAAEEEEESSGTAILKCIDASGGTIFTQGYCPPGSKQVRTSSNP